MQKHRKKENYIVKHCQCDNVNSGQICTYQCNVYCVQWYPSVSIVSGAQSDNTGTIEQHRFFRCIINYLELKYLDSDSILLP